MKNLSLYITLILFSASSCKKLVQVDTPPNQLTPDKIFSDSSSVAAATVNMFTLLGTADNNFVKPVGTYTDELVTTTVSGVAPEYSNSRLSVTNTSVLSVWQNLYATIYKANALIAGIQQFPGISNTLKRQCLGEAKFIRAYCHWLLANFHGNIPLVLSTDITINALATRSDQQSIFSQVTADLNDAVNLLPVNYPFSGDKIEANKWAAATLLAKVYLQTQDYAKAESMSSQVINSGAYSLMTNLNGVFNVNSNEAILQLWNSTGFTTLNSVPSSGIPAYQISPALLSAFESGDQRKTNWVKSTTVSGTSYFYPYKYKQRLAATGANAEYTMYFRLSELYLIRAEARAMLNNVSGGLTDLNVIRNRAGLPSLVPNSQADLLKAILHERQVELFNESANRFFDLKRAGMIDNVLTPLKPLWQTTGSLFPIPQSEILSDPNLLQNPGY